MEEATHGMEIVTRYFADFTKLQLQQLTALCALYTYWNERINVISRKDIGSLYEKHVLHSLSIAAVFDFRAGSRVIDIGTGGGFPGIPLAIYFPEVQFHLVDSIGKKLKVVEAIKGSLELKNVSTEQTRAEEITGRKFDIAVSRAVAPLKDLWKWSKPLLKSMHLESGRKLPFANGLICLKGGDLSTEIAESGTRPKIREISQFFPEESFRGKYILHIPGIPAPHLQRKGRI